MIAPLINTDVLTQMTTNEGETVYKISFQKPVFLVFLRHFGCVFCQEALSDLSEMLDNIRDKNVRLIMVHMAEAGLAEKYFGKFNLKKVSHISDTELTYYTHFGLTKGKFSQLYGLSTWMRSFSIRSKGYKLELAKQLGDATQMPGIYTLYEGEIIDSYIHRRASDKPDYDNLLQRATDRIRKN